MRFLAPLRNDSGGGVTAVALPGTTDFSLSLEMTGSEYLSVIGMTCIAVVAMPESP
jgi:hypothetical protein